MGKKLYQGLLILLFLTVVTSLVLGGCKAEEAGKLRVVTSTSLLSYIVEQVGGDRVDVVNIVPGGQHPGDFDAKPGDIQKLAEAALFLWHGWPGETFVEGLLASADNPDLVPVKIEIEGSWMTPPVQLRAADKVAAALGQVDSENSQAYQKAAAEYRDRVTVKEAEVRTALAGINPASINVMCAFWQAGFLGWAGFNLVETYGDPETLAPQVVQGLVDKGREAKVTLIVDNVHSGKDAGAGIAEELGVARAVLLNFPGGFEDTETWEKAIQRNVDLLLAALGQ